MRISLLPFVSWIVAAPAYCATIRVPGDQGTLQAGLAAATAGDTVLVAPGTYFEHSLAVPGGISLLGEGGDASAVVVDAVGGGPVLRCVDGTDARIEGLTFRGGQAPRGTGNAGGGLHCADSSPVFTRCRFVENAAEFGAGAGCLHSSPIFRDCEFTSNTATSSVWAAGGGLYCHEATVILDDCLVLSNTADSFSLPGDGGGVFSQRSLVKGTRCTFNDNSAGAGGGAVYSYDIDATWLVDCTLTGNSSHAGGAVYLESSFARLEGCTFVGNEAGNGGALFIARWSMPSITGCHFETNRARPHSGGAVDVWESVPRFEDCTFEGNTAQLDGGAIVANGLAQLQLTRCTVLGNTAARSGGAIRSCYATSLEIESCTFAGNGAPSGGTFCQQISGPLSMDRTIVAFSTTGVAVACGDTSRVVLTCSDVFGNAGGDWVGVLAGQDSLSGNFRADPLFCDAAAGDLTLEAPRSPCLPSGNDCGVLVGARDVGCIDVTNVDGRFEALSWSRIKTRFREAR